MAEAFACEQGQRVEVEFATAPELRTRVEGGEQADVIVASVAVMDALAKAGRIVPHSRCLVGRSRMGVVVHEEAPIISVSDVESFKRILAAAAFVVYNKASSGIYAARLLEDLGLASLLGSRIVVVNTGAAVLEYVAQHPPAVVGLAQISEIRVLIEKGLPIRLAGPLPDAVQNITTYEAAAVERGPSVSSAEALASYLATVEAKAIFAATGID